MKNAGGCLLHRAGKKDLTVTDITGRDLSRKRIQHPDDDRRRRDFAAEIYRQEMRHHWQPKGLTKHDRLEVTRRSMRGEP
jgi:hypothetical protein